MKNTLFFGLFAAALSFSACNSSFKLRTVDFGHFYSQPSIPPARSPIRTFDEGIYVLKICKSWFLDTTNFEQVPVFESCPTATFSDEALIQTVYLIFTNDGRVIYKTPGRWVTASKSLPPGEIRFDSDNANQKLRGYYLIKPQNGVWNSLELRMENSNGELVDFQVKIDGDMLHMNEIAFKQDLAMAHSATPPPIQIEKSLHTKLDFAFVNRADLKFEKVELPFVCTFDKADFDHIRTTTDKREYLKNGAVVKTELLNAVKSW